MSIVDMALVELLTARTVTLTGDRKSLNSLRVMLYRKLQDHIEQWDAVGYLNESLRDTTINLEWTEQGAIMKIVPRKPRLQFKILTGTPDGTSVSTDLEHNQSSQIQHRSPDQDSQGNAEDTDSGGAQGESDGQRSTPSDWESVVREFIAQGDSGQAEL